MIKLYLACGVGDIEDLSRKSVPCEMVKRRAGNPAATFAAPELSFKGLGWRARYDLETIVQSAYAKHRSQVEARNLALVSSDYGKSHQLGRRVGVRRANAV